MLPMILETFHDALSDWSPNRQLNFSAGSIIENENDLLSTELADEETINVDSVPGRTPPSSQSSGYEGESKVPENGHLNNGEFQSTFEPVKSKMKQALGSVQLAQLVMPKSKYFGYIPPLPSIDEETAVLELLENVESTETKDFVEFELSEFVVYLPENKHHPFEMRGLQFLSTRTGHSSFLFDGILTYGKERRYVQEVPFKICSIGNYGQDRHMVGSQIWIQSDLNSKANIFYRLETPSAQYMRFHEGFLWIANLGKHFVDFCEARPSPTSLYDFQSEFSRWIISKHWDLREFQKWYNDLGSDDFRTAVSHNISFLFKESIGVNEKLRTLPIWTELLDMNSVPKQKIVEVGTIVTPFVYDCFKHMRFGHYLKAIKPSKDSEKQQVIQENALELTSNHDFNNRMPSSPSSVQFFPKVQETASIEIRNASLPVPIHEKQVKLIKIGDVLSVTKDGEDSIWKDEVSRWKAADDCWYVYVQGVHIKYDGKRSFDGLWLYKPSDTSCAKMKYPFLNELFLSDNCTCVNGRIPEEMVLDIVSVQWNCHPSNSRNQFFIRQTYLENERFVTLRESHKVCQHLQLSTAPSSREKYLIGQTVLAPPRSKTKYDLEAYEIDKYILEGTKKFVMLRRLQRRASIDGGRPNELLYTNKFEKQSPQKIHSKCLVRFFTESEVTNKKVPAPYCRDGTGNAFYITSKLVESDEGQTVKAFSEGEGFPLSLIQGFNPSDSADRRLLRGMDLYCGGGNFGRGLEEGGAVKNEYAVDLDQHAIHVYAANLKTTDTTKLWYGSVNDLLSQAMQGNPKKSRLIPLPGDVDFISAGSPCQGFSTLNDSRNDEKGLKNQSMVASVAAYIDFYRPSYGLLENVMAMARKGLGRDEDVLSQLICAIVAMGYQLQIFVVDAWSCGGPQSRTRLFVSFAAPGMEPLEHPALSHSHPPDIPSRGLGKLANGQPFGRRIHGLTAFKFVSAEEATKDLPRIGDGITYHCTNQPNHVVVRQITQTLKKQIEAIPTRPRGMNFRKAWQDGKGSMTLEERELFPLARNGVLPENVTNRSQGWGRVDPRKPFALICQSILPSDSRNGPVIHWKEQRTLTLMEGRRIQGFPDDEILPGPPNEGWKRLGNSVSRQVSLALGLSLREAWLKNPPENKAKGLVAVDPSSISRALTINDESKNKESPLVVMDKVHRSIQLPIVDSIVPRTDSKASSSFRTTNINNQVKPMGRTPLIEIPDSDDSSGNEDLCGAIFQNSVQSIPIRRLAPVIRGEKSSKGNERIPINNETQRRSLKRLYSAMSEGQTFMPKKVIKPSPSAELFTEDSQRESRLTLPLRKSMLPIPSLTTSKSIEEQMGESTANTVDEIVDSDLEGLSALKSPRQAPVHTPRKGHSKSLNESAFALRFQSKPKTRTKHEDEDEDEAEAEFELAQVRTSIKQTPHDYPDTPDPPAPRIPKPTYTVSIPRLESNPEGEENPNSLPRRTHELGSIRPPPAPYEPSNNTAFTAYERSHTFFGHEKNRKHGPMSGW